MNFDKKAFIGLKTNKEMLTILFFRLDLLEKIIVSNSALLASIVSHLGVEYDEIALESLLRSETLYRGLRDVIQADQTLIDAQMLLNYGDD